MPLKTFWADVADPIGRRFHTRGIDGPEFEVVGVVGDYKVETVGEQSRPYVHYPFAQQTSTAGVLIARTAGDVDGLLAAMRRELLALEPNTVWIEAQR